MIIINNKFFFNKNQIKYIPLLNTTYNLNKIKNNLNNLDNLDLNISLFNDYELNIFYEFINYINKIKFKNNLESLNEKEIK